MLRRERHLAESRAALHRPLVALRWLAFWLAIIVPIVYVAILAVGLDRRTTPVLLGAVSLNLVCLLVGHEYSP